MKRKLKFFDSEQNRRMGKFRGLSTLSRKLSFAKYSNLKILHIIWRNPRQFKFNKDDNIHKSKALTKDGRTIEH